jgi:hypothetical protein
MALTQLQRAVCRLIAGNRIRSGESYVAGGVALIEVIGAARISRDIDLFHDTDQAVDAAWDADRTFVEAEVGRSGDTVVLQWARDSAYRFFPLVEHAELGLILHPFDLATNKVLALVGRVEARDWIDVLECCRRIQPLGYLAWAACGKDPGFSPTAILEQAGRTVRYSRAEIEALSFDEPVPDPAELSKTWHTLLDEARVVVATLPAEEAGKCVLMRDGALFQAGPATLRTSLAGNEIVFHAGRIRGALPQLAAPRS